VADALRDIAVEALWNVDRHARASVLLLSLAVEDAGVRFDIVDDGVDVARRQVAAWGSSVDLGLRRMRRVVKAVGGRLALHSLQPRGLRQSVVVPSANGSVR
jgi:signal transduction histidine kinase